MSNHFTFTQEEDEKKALHAANISKLEAEVRQMVASLDRDKLGEFAVDEEKIFVLLLNGKAGASTTQVTNIYGHDFVSNLISWELESTPEERAEAVFWARRKNFPITGGYSNELWHRCTLAYMHGAEYHEYFRVGLWDVKLIEKCLLDGVDPELALTLSL